LTYYSDNASLGPARLQRITGPVSGATTDFAYDGKGRLQTVTESDGYAVTAAYDDLDRPTSLTYPDGTFEQTVYTRLDATDQRDRLGRWSHFFYDAVRRLALTRDPLGNMITQQWCNCGVLDKLIDANGNTTSWTRDIAGRVTTETRADSSTTQYAFENTTSRLKQRTDRKSQQTNYTYFADNNVNTISYTNVSPATSSVSFTYDPVYNRRVTMADGTGTTTYAYNAITTGGTLGAGELLSVSGRKCCKPER
jgi:YD repeat-containing protein